MGTAVNHGGGTLELVDLLKIRHATIHNISINHGLNL